MLDFSYAILDFFNLFEFKLIIYFYWFCMAPLVYTQEMADFYLDLVLNYGSYYNDIIHLPTKLYDDDLFSILELNEIYVDDYFFSVDYFNTLPDLIHRSFFKKVIVTFFSFFFYITFTIFLIKYVILEYLPSVGLLDLSQFYFEFEHNVGNGEDLLMIISLVLALIIWICCYFYVSSSTVEINIVLFLIFLVFVLIPIRIVISFGSNLINYIKGTSESNKFSVELFSDTIMIAVFLVRFGLQAIRIVLIYIFYFSIHEYVFVLPKEYLTNLSTSWSKWKFTMGSLLCDFLRWAFELLDSTVSIFNQIASFFFVIFWLFSYINTCELKRKKLFWFKSIKISFLPINSQSYRTVFTFKINY